MDFQKFKQAMVAALGKQRTLSPEERAQRSMARRARYEHRNATYPYDNYRQRERYGIAHDARMIKWQEAHPNATQEEFNAESARTDRP